MSSTVKKFRIKRIGRRSGVVHEHIVLVDAEDAHYLRSSYWRVQICTAQRSVYVTRTTRNGPEFLHHVIVGAPRDEQVQHINGDPLDNRKENLLRASARIEEAE